MKNRGFTLIELLVVIAILGILASIIVVNMVAARANAQDVKRNAIARNYVAALNMHFAVYGEYPSPGSSAPICLGNGACDGYYNATVHNAIATYYPSMEATNVVTSNYTYTGPWYWCGMVNGKCTTAFFTWYLENPTGKCAMGGTHTNMSTLAQCQYYLK